MQYCQQWLSRSPLCSVKTLNFQFSFPARVKGAKQILHLNVKHLNLIIVWFSMVSKLSIVQCGQPWF